MSLNPQRRSWLQLALLCATIYGVAFAARMLLFPEVVPVAFAEVQQQPLAVQGAFLLLAIEMIASLSGILLLIAACATLLDSRRAPINTSAHLDLHQSGQSFER
jgi:hypothetical protein